MAEHKKNSTRSGVAKTRREVRNHYPEGISALEIGSGSNPESGYVHLDIQPDLPDLDILSDVRSMPIPDNFVADHIRAVHIMEHFCHPKWSGAGLQRRYGTTVEVLEECYRVLKPGGRLLIVTPDFSKIAFSKAWRRVPQDWLQRWSVGGHLDEFDVHHWLWTWQDAQRWLTQVGFRNVTDWNPTPPRTALKYLLNPPAPGSPNWFRFEWFHWLFVSATKPEQA